MRIACPNCAAAYEVPDSILAAGPRLLRCTRCGHQFPAALPQPGAAPPEATAPAFPPASPPASPLASPGAPAFAPPGPPPAPPAAGPMPPPGAPDLPPPADPGRPPPTRGLSRHSPMEPLLPREAESGEEDGRRSPVPMALAWILSFAILGAAGWAVVQYRAEIAAAWPPAARLYAALGLG